MSAARRSRRNDDAGLSRVCLGTGFQRVYFDRLGVLGGYEADARNAFQNKWLSHNPCLSPRSIGESQMEQGFVVRRLLLPADQDPPEAVHPRGDAFDHPAPGTPAAGSLGSLFLAARLDMGPVAASAGFAAESGGIIALVAAQMLRTTRGGAGTANRKTVQRGMKQLLVMHIGAGDGQARGTPRPSVSTERLTPNLPRSVGFFPVFFPAQGCLGARSVKTLPPPLDAPQGIVPSEQVLPKFVEQTALRPLLEVAVQGTAGAEFLRRCFPLATRA